MHPKEFKKTKNGTGHFTHLSLPNSKIFIGIDFTHHKYINDILDDKTKNCYVLYPHKDSIKLNEQSIQQPNKTNVIFIIDSTWACSVKLLRVSTNLHNLPKISFQHTKISAFKIKTQPNIYCLSTIESTLCILELLTNHKIEDITNEQLENFLEPFNQMVAYQVKCNIESGDGSVRYKIPYKDSK